MADTGEINVWMYPPSFALAVLATVFYGIIFIWITYLTIIKYRAWFFLCVVVGAVVEVAGYAIRCYSIKNPSEIVSASAPPAISRYQTNGSIGRFCLDALPNRPRARLRRCRKLPSYRPTDPCCSCLVDGVPCPRRPWSAHHAHLCAMRHSLLFGPMCGIGSGEFGGVGRLDG